SQAGQGRSGRICARRAPLADPARPLRVQGAQARLPALRDSRSMRVSTQDHRLIVVQSAHGHDDRPRMTPARGAPAETDPGAAALTARQRAGTARRVAFGLAALLLAADLLAWAACAPWQGPWTPRATMAFAGDDFDERLGTAFGLDGRLQVIAPGAAHTNMQTRRM